MNVVHYVGCFSLFHCNLVNKLSCIFSHSEVSFQRKFFYQQSNNKFLEILKIDKAEYYVGIRLPHGRLL